MMFASPAILSECSLYLDAFRRRPYRTMSQFACEEIIIPTGPFEGEYFSFERQPFAKLWFDEVDSGNWNQFVCTGPSQSGKSLIGFVIPVCYYLFEMQETVIAPVPDGDLVNDKWELDLLPVIKRTRYRDLLPDRGAGAKGGASKAFRFRNGVTLRFMTAGGKDKSTASFTSPNICFTETDGFDQTQKTSDEGTKIQQIEARARAYSRRRRRIFKECTVSTDKKHTWHMYTKMSSSSRIVLPCPHCSHWVTLEREHFVGWQDTQNEREAEAKGTFCCSHCGVIWSEQERVAANRKGKLLHKGQTITKEGVIEGPLPDTSTLGFRWSAVNNCLLTSGDFAVDEYEARLSPEPELAERKMKQFVWSVPTTDDSESVGITSEEIRNRTVANMPKGYVPLDTNWITLGVDVNKRFLTWTAIAWRKQLTAHIFDYGRIENPADELGFDKAIIGTLKDLSEDVTKGWTVPKYTYAFCDIRWKTQQVLRAISNLKDRRWFPCIGLGDGHFSLKQKYNHPTKVAGDITDIGAQYYLKKHHGFSTVFTDANSWKTELQTMLRLQFDREKGETVPGAMTVYDSSDKNEHVEFANHLTAEEGILHYDAKKKGYWYEWKQRSKSNHLLDSTSMATAAGHLAGFRVVDESGEEETAGSFSRPFFRKLTMPDGRPFSILDR